MPAHARAARTTPAGAGKTSANARGDHRFFESVHLSKSLFFCKSGRKTVSTFGGIALAGGADARGAVSCPGTVAGARPSRPDHSGRCRQDVGEGFRAGQTQARQVLIWRPARSRHRLLPGAPLPAHARAARTPRQVPARRPRRLPCAANASPPNARGDHRFLNQCTSLILESVHLSQSLFFCNSGRKTVFTFRGIALERFTF